MRRKSFITLLIISALALPLPQALANETTNSVAKKTSEIAAKTSNAVGRGLRKTGEAINHAGMKTSAALHRASTKLGITSSSAANNGTNSSLNN